MDAAPCYPGDGLAGTGGDAQLVSRGPVVCLDLTAELDTNRGNISEACAVSGPDAEGMAIDADIGQAVDAIIELLKLGT